jgi:hypothetical protein
MDGLMAETVQEKHWYLSIGDRSIGPLTTELVARGIQAGKVPLTAWICEVGANAWSVLSSFGEFQDVLDRMMAAQIPANQQSSESTGSSQSSGVEGRNAEGQDEGTAPESAVSLARRQDAAEALPRDRTENDALPSWAKEVDGADVVTSAPEFTSCDQAGEEAPLATGLPSFSEEISGEHDISPVWRQGLRAEQQRRRTSVHGQQVGHRCESAVPAETAAADVAVQPHDELGIDITFDDGGQEKVGAHKVGAGRLDWTVRFQSYFLVGTDVELPDEDLLLTSLAEAPRSTFAHDEALWNLALCLAYGSDRVAASGARIFFEALAPADASERIEWVCRTLLSSGFMPSGIPRSEGLRGVEMLRMACPPEFCRVLERTVSS